MSEDHRTIEEIEAELERERLALQANLAALQEKMSLKGMTQEAMGLVSPATASTARSLASSFDSTVRAHPVAALLAGGGLVWLAFGRGGRKQRPAAAPRSNLGSNVATTVSAAATIASAVAAMDPDDVRAIADEIDKIYRAGAAKLRSLDAEIRRKAAAVGEGLRDSSEKAGDFATEKARIVADVAAEVKARLGEGLEGLTEEAAAAVMAARERAYMARRQASETASAAYAEIASVVDKHPLAAGAGALALGALLAVALGTGSKAEADGETD